MKQQLEESFSSHLIFSLLCFSTFLILSWLFVKKSLFENWLLIRESWQIDTGMFHQIFLKKTHFFQKATKNRPQITICVHWYPLALDEF